MPINRSILLNNVNRKLQYDCMSAIVTEALVKSLPLNKRAIAGETKNMRQFVRSTLEDMHALESLNESYEKMQDMHKKAFLYNLKDAIESVSFEAAQRIATEQAANPDMKDVVDHAGFTQAELKKFASKADSISMNSLTNMINNKVVKVLKDEMVAYEQEETLRRELRDTIQAQKDEMDQRLNPDDLTDGADDEATGEEMPEPEDVETPPTEKPEEEGSKTQEDITANADAGDEQSSDEEEDEEDEDEKSLDSFMNIALQKHDVRNHISFFSKLQDIATENLTYYKADVDHLCYPLMESMLESTFDVFPKKEYTLNEQLTRLTLATESVDANVDVNKIAYIASVVVYTLLETLKTMNVYSPSATDVKDVVGTPLNSAPALGSSIETIKAKVMENLNTMQSNMMKKDKNALEEDLESMQNLKDSVLKVSKQHSDLATKVVPSIDKAMEAVQTRLNNLRVKTPATESRFISMRRTENIAAMDRLKRYANYPEAQKIQIVVDPANETFVDVNVLRKNGTVMRNEYVTLNRNPELGDLNQVVMESLELGSLKDCRCAVSVYYTDKCTEKVISESK